MPSDLKALEFDGIRRLLEKLAAGPYGADAARHLEPAPDLAAARRFQDAVTAARQALDAGEPVPVRELPDIRPALRQAANVGAALSPSALNNLRQVMQAALALVAELARRPTLYPEGAAVLQPPAALLALLDRVLADTGRLREDASQALQALYAEQRQLTDEATATVRKRMHEPDVVDLFEDPDKVKWHGQRAVIVLHRDLGEKVKGVRRGSAMGGRDVLIEPIEVLGLNNRIEALGGRITAEEQRLLREITAEVRTVLEPLQDIVTALAWIDLAAAAARLSAYLNAHPPKLVEAPVLELAQAYHPLLLLQFADGTGPQPVPLTLRLDADQRLLVITGPNTGGKTVVLKTVGLLTCMAHCGLHIPAEADCTVGNYRRVMVDVGDHQSLYHHLSTFAGHVEMLKRILGEADGKSLVLLDELGTGTDPEEGAALAMSVMDELVERGVHGIVNTHLSPLKEYAAGKAHVRNASVLFDHRELKPTYQLCIGTPGESLGLIVAERNGLAAELVQRAREHLARISGRER